MDYSYARRFRKLAPAYPDGKRKAFTMSYDDGNTCDEKLVALMRRYGVKGTFNINAGRFYEEGDPLPQERRWRHLTVQEAVELYGEDMEIGIHGYVHPHWEMMAGPNLMQDILDDKRFLEEASGRLIRGGAYPYGTFSQEAVEILRLADMRYCRAIIARNSLEYTAIMNPLLFLPTCHHNGPQALQLADQLVQEESNELRLYYLWGHSFEFVREDNWEQIEKILQRVAGREDIWYPTNLELFDYMAAFAKLHFNVDADKVYNPTDKTLWMTVLHKKADPISLLELPAGAVTEIPD